MNRTALLLLAACGGSSARPDATPADALESTGSVTVIVTERGNPVAGLPVFFRNATTSFEAVTSISGSSGFNLDGGYVTVLLPRKRYGIDRLYTFADVKMEDHLLLELEPRGPQSVEVTVTVAPDAGNNGPFLIYTSCDGEEPFGTAANATPPPKLALECTGQQTDALAVRVDPETNRPLSAQLKLGASLDGPIAFDGAYDTIDPVTVSSSNHQPSTFVHVTHSIVTTNGRVFDSFAGGPPNDPMNPIVVHQPRAPGANYQTVASAYPAADAMDDQQIYQWSSVAATTPMMIDFAARLPAYTSRGQYDAQKRAITWTEAGGARPPVEQLVRARVQFHRDDIPQGTAWTWDIVARRKGATIEFPELPPQPFDLNPLPTDTAAIMELTNIALPAGVAYDTVRPRGFSDVNRLVPPRNSGTMVVQRRFEHEPTDDGISDPP